MTPEQAIQLLSDALEPRNINAISRQGFIAIQEAIETIAEALKQSNPNDPNDD